MNSRQIIASLAAPLAVAAFLGLAGCKKESGEAKTAESAAAPAVPTFKPAFISINLEQQATWVRNFNPFSPDRRMQSDQGVIYEPLMIYNKAADKLVPWLATEFSWSPNYDTLTFKLRDGVKWSDGEPFTAKDVVYTFNLVKAKPQLINNLGSLLTDNVSTFTAKDDHTVEFKFKKIHTPALYVLTGQLIVPEHIWKGVKDPAAWTNENPVGTGPFTQITKFENQIYTIEKNPHYWQPGKPYFQGIKCPAYPGNDQANMALVNGELDWTSNFLPDAEKTFISKNPKTNHAYFVGGDSVLLYLNPRVKPFDKVDVRKAISRGINRKAIVNVAMFDYVPGLDVTGLSESFKSWKDETVAASENWTDFDAKAANEALDKLGYKKGSDGIRVADGKPMAYKIFAVNGWTDWISAAQIIVQNLKDLGIAATLETPEQNSWQDAVFKGKFDMTIGYSSGGATPYSFYRGQMSQSTVKKVGEVSQENWGRFVAPGVDKLLDEFAATGDLAKQRDIMKQIQAIFVKEAPALPLFPGPDWYEYSTARFEGFPSKENPYAPGTLYNAPLTSIQALLVWTSIYPK